MTLPELITRLRQRITELGDDAQATPAELRALVAVAEECDARRLRSPKHPWSCRCAACEAVADGQIEADLELEAIP